MFMLNKLAFKNAQRQWKDYVIYFFTLCMVVALMLAFNSLLFSSDIYKSKLKGRFYEEKQKCRIGGEKNILNENAEA